MKILPHDIHIWVTNLTRPSASDPNYDGWISDDEQEKAKRLYSSAHRRRYIVARSTLRKILSYYLSVSPQTIKFDYSKYHKPFLSFPTSDLEFNLSHSENLAI